MEIIQFFSIVGTVAFSIQGGLIAIKNKYDLFAVYLFGMITAFGGGALRHIVIGESTHDLSAFRQKTPTSRNVKGVAQ